jgi:hypothetical protein
MKPPVLVIIESPYRGKNTLERELNTAYLKLCILDSLQRGEAPIASHRMYPGILDEDAVHSHGSDRDRGIQAGYEWFRVAERIVFYTDFGFSPGMNKALTLCQSSNPPYPTECRKLFKSY